MCAEALWWRCHRSLIADYLKAAGHTVIHIIDETKTEEHPFTSAARIVDGELSYEDLTLNVSTCCTRLVPLVASNSLCCCATLWLSHLSSGASHPCGAESFSDLQSQLSQRSRLRLPQSRRVSVA